MVHWQLTKTRWSKWQIIFIKLCSRRKNSCSRN
uniref:Uncharacterized protein n=1 Tax=Arundo donax TaxID=35708 RepID=A0A0A8ZC18_ARUDO